MPLTDRDRSALCKEAIQALEADGPVPSRILDVIERLRRDDPDALATEDLAGDLRAALGLVPVGHWWHVGHLGMTYTPTAPDDGTPMTRAADHLPGGRPVAYEAWGTDSGRMRETLARLACVAVLRAWRADATRSMTAADGRVRVVQTGRGPLAAMPDGRLAEIPPDARLTADGRLVPYSVAEHGVDGRVEDPDA